MVDNNNIINNLLDIGFSENEAKAYIALLIGNPATAYEIAKNSAIPTSKIYEVIGKLVDKKIILEIEENKKTKYIPVSCDELLDSYKISLDNKINSLRNDLANIKKESDLSYIWNITDYEYLINKAVRMIQSSKKTILLSIWPQEYEKIRPYLAKAEKRKVKISIVLFGNSDEKTGLIFKHPIEDTLYSEKGGRGLALVCDSEEVLIGTVSGNNKVEGALSKNKGFFILAEDYIKHDIYIMKIVNRFNELLTKTFGDNYAKLRDVFNDKEES
jgi:HTH-type transcriptional regulator, sugar sensing transcriptional regulator